MPTHSSRWLALWSILGPCLLAGIVLRCYLPDHGLYDVTGYLLGRDFVNVWMAAHLTTQGDALAAYDIHQFIAQMRGLFGADFPFHNWSYPPTILPFILPFSTLPYGPALLLWTGLGLLCFLYATRLENHHGAHWPYLLLLALSPAAIVNILSGQNGFFTAACFVGGLSILNRRPWLAGVLFGLLTIKPHLGVLIPVVLILLHQWRAFAAATFTTLLLVATSLMCWGIAPWQDYIAHVLPYQHALLTIFEGFYTRMMPGTFAAARIIGLPYQMAMLIHIAIALLAAVLALRITAREGASPRAILALSIATMLITPYGYNYDLTATSAALVVYLYSTPVPHPHERLLFGGLWVLPAAIFPLQFAHLPLGPWLMLLPLLSLAHRSAYP